MGITISRTRHTAMDLISMIGESIKRASSRFEIVASNPVLSKGEINIEWQKNLEGYYTFQLTNISGKELFERDFWMDSSDQVISLPMPSATPGLYFLIITSRSSGETLTLDIYL
jgi:hypothetical protein